MLLSFDVENGGKLSVVIRKSSCLFVNVCITEHLISAVTVIGQKYQ